MEFKRLPYPVEKSDTKCGSIQLLAKISLVILFGLTSNYAIGQAKKPANAIKTDSLLRDSTKIYKPVDSSYKQYDVADLFRAILHPHSKPKPFQKKSGITIIPNIAYNPSIGAQIGIKAVAGRILGHEPNTLMSVAATSASITTKGIIYFYISHNIYTPGNKWNFQGSLVAAKTVTPDFGLGIGNATDDGNEADKVLTNPDRKGYVLHAQYYNFREKVYKQIEDHLFVGAGVSFDIRRKIEDRNSTSDLTPYNIYSDRHGFDRDNYMSNGLLFNLSLIHI